VLFGTIAAAFQLRLQRRHGHQNQAALQVKLDNSLEHGGSYFGRVRRYELTTQFYVVVL
jgi:hypothetical protein